MRQTGLICLFVAMLAVTAQARHLQQQNFDLSKLDLSKLPALPALGLMPTGVQMPPLQDFLPPLDSINLPPLNEFLTSVGLPTWEEMNLPPLSEFMKPVFDPQQVELPSLADVVNQANATFVATLQEILKGVPLPEGVKLPELKLPPLPNVDLSKIQVPALDPTKLPKMPTLDQVITGLNALQHGDLATLAKAVNISLPQNLPPVNEIMTALAPLADAASKIPNMDLSKIDLSKLDVSSLLQAAQGLQKVPAVAEILKALPPLPDNVGAGLQQLPALLKALPPMPDNVQLDKVLPMAMQLMKMLPAGNKPTSRHLLAQQQQVQ